MFFGGEIIKEGTFADIGGLGNVLDGGVKISTPGKNLQGGSINAFPSFDTSPLAPVDPRTAFRASDGKSDSRRFHCHMFTNDDLWTITTIGHITGEDQEGLV